MIMTRRVLEPAERIVLSERDTERVLKLLENPPKPTPALLAAARRRRARAIKAGGKRSKP
jgi:uncharacterized protein (DUF1778 family)